jgi:hypothetical protein
MAEYGPRRPKLIERHAAVHDVAADQAELALQPEWRKRAVAKYQTPKPRREPTAPCSSAGSSQRRPFGNAGANC